jgi:hypothetical protein
VIPDQGRDEMDVKDLVTFIPLTILLFTATTFINQRLEIRRTYLRLSLKLEEPVDGVLVAHTKIDNVVVRVKKLTAVYLLLGPEEEDPMDTVNILLTQRVSIRRGCCPIALRDYFPLGNMVDTCQRRRLVPLPYYTVENINIADELLTYSKSIDVSSLPAGCYAVRMYVYGEERLYRVVQTIFTQPAAAARLTLGHQPSTDLFIRPPCQGLRHCPHPQGWVPETTSSRDQSDDST